MLVKGATGRTRAQVIYKGVFLHNAFQYRTMLLNATRQLQIAWVIVWTYLCSYVISTVSCERGPTSHAYAWQIGPFWQDTLDISVIAIQIIGVLKPKTLNCLFESFFRLTTNKTPKHHIIGLYEEWVTLTKDQWSGMHFHGMTSPWNTWAVVPDYISDTVWTLFVRHDICSGSMPKHYKN